MDDSPSDCGLIIDEDPPEEEAAETFQPTLAPGAPGDQAIESTDQPGSSKDQGGEATEPPPEDDSPIDSGGLIIVEDPEDEEESSHPPEVPSDRPENLIEKPEEERMDTAESQQLPLEAPQDQPEGNMDKPDVPADKEEEEEEEEPMDVSEVPQDLPRRTAGEEEVPEALDQPMGQPDASAIQPLTVIVDQPTVAPMGSTNSPMSDPLREHRYESEEGMQEGPSLEQIAIIPDPVLPHTTLLQQPATASKPQATGSAAPPSVRAEQSTTSTYPQETIPAAHPTVPFAQPQLSSAPQTTAQPNIRTPHPRTSSAPLHTSGRVAPQPKGGPSSSTPLATGRPPLRPLPQPEDAGTGLFLYNYDFYDKRKLVRERTRKRRSVKKTKEDAGESTDQETSQPMMRRVKSLEDLGPIRQELIRHAKSSGQLSAVPEDSPPAGEAPVLWYRPKKYAKRRPKAVKDRIVEGDDRPMDAASNPMHHFAMGQGYYHPMEWMGQPVFEIGQGYVIPMMDASSSMHHFAPMGRGYSIEATYQRQLEMGRGYYRAMEAMYQREVEMGQGFAYPLVAQDQPTILERGRGETLEAQPVLERPKKYAKRRVTMSIPEQSMHMDHGDHPMDVDEVDVKPGRVLFAQGAVIVDDVDEYPRVAKPMKVTKVDDDVTRPRIAVRFRCAGETTFEWLAHRHHYEIAESQGKYEISTRETFDFDGHRVLHIYHCVLIINGFENEDEGDYTCRATTRTEQGELTTDISGTLIMGLDRVVRLTEESIEPVHCAPMKHRRYRKETQLKGDRIFANTCALVPKGERFFRRTVGSKKGRGKELEMMVEVISRKSRKLIPELVFMEKHYAKMKAYFIEQFGEGALEEQEEDHAYVNDVIDDGEPDPERNLFWLAWKLPDEFPLDHPHKVEIVHLMNAFQQGDHTAFTSVIRNIQCRLANIDFYTDPTAYEKHLKWPFPHFDKTETAGHDGVTTNNSARTGKRATSVRTFEEVYSRAPILTEDEREKRQMERELRGEKTVRFAPIPPKYSVVIPESARAAADELGPRPPVGIRPCKQADSQIFSVANGGIEVTMFVYGAPPPEVQWFLNSKIMHKRDDAVAETRQRKIGGKTVLYQRIVIPKKLQSDRFSLLARVQNPCGILEEKFNFDLRKPQGISLASDPVVKMFLKQTHVELYCRLKLAPGVNRLNLRWEREGLRMDVNQLPGVKKRMERNGDNSVTVALMIEDPSMYPGEWRCIMAIDESQRDGLLREGLEYKPLLASWNLRFPLPEDYPEIRGTKALMREVVKPQWVEKNAVFQVFYSGRLKSWIEWVNPRGRVMTPNKEGGRLTMNGGLTANGWLAKVEMEIAPVFPVDAGTYICRINTDLGCIEAAFDLMIEPEDESMYPGHMHGSKKCPYYIKNAAVVAAINKNPTPKGGLVDTDQVNESCYLAELKNQGVEEMAKEATFLATYGKKSTKELAAELKRVEARIAELRAKGVKETNSGEETSDYYY